MKNRFLWLLILGMALFSGCSDDDDDFFKNYSVDYSADKLDLKLNGKSFTGASVSFSSADKENAAVTLNGLIPGEPTLEVKNLVVTELSGKDYSFVGENKNDDRTISVEGTVKSGVLNLGTSFKVTSKVVEDWKLAPYVEDSGVPVSSGLYMNIVPEADTSTIMGMPVESFVIFASSIGGQLLPQLLTKVELKVNGSLVATYLDMSAEEPSVLQSPEELVRYNVKDGLLYLAIDLASLNLDFGALIDGRSEQGANGILNMLVNGIPLKFDIKEEGLLVYVDQQMMLPFMDVIREMLIPMMQNSDDLKEMVPLVYDIIRLVEKSQKIELGLHLVPYVEEVPAPAAMVLPQSVEKFMQKFAE